MATTKIPIGSPMAQQLWAKQLDIETPTWISLEKLMGESSNNIIQVTEAFRKEAGDRITKSLVAGLYGTGVSENQVLEGHEERLQFLHESFVINEINHAVRIKTTKSIDNQRTTNSLRDLAQDALRMWWPRHFEQMAFIQWGGYTPETLLVNGRVLRVRDTVYGFNTPTAPTDERIIRPDGKTKDEDLTNKETHIMTRELIERAVELAQTATPAIRPVLVDGDERYILYLHPYQITALRNSTTSGDWFDIQKAMYSSKGRKNPIYTGALGEIDGVILRRARDVVPGVHSTTNAPVPNVRRAVFLGAQSLLVGFARGNAKSGRYGMTEERFDYEREAGFAFNTIMGMKKTQYKSEEAGTQPQDYGTIVISTYAARRTS